MKTSIFKISTLISVTFLILQITSCKKHECINPSKSMDTVIITQKDTLIVTKTDTIIKEVKPSTIKFVASNDPSDVEDCGVTSLLTSIDYSDFNTFNCYTWTQSGNTNIVRNFIKFDMSSIPSDAIVDSAFISFFSGQGILVEDNSGDNAAYIERVTSTWSESTIKWNNQPTVTSTNRVTLAAVGTANVDMKNINVTNMVKDILTVPNLNYGFRLSMVNETPYKNLIFCSTDHTDPAKRPQFVVYYH